MAATIDRPTPPPPGMLRRIFSAIGPGLIAGAADDDPSGIATYVQTGAQFGYAQLWTALFALPLLTAVQEASARIGAVTGKGLALVVRERYGVKPVYAMVSLLVLANTINLGADLGAMAAAAQLLIPLPFVVLAVAFAVGIVVVETFTSYRAYARILKWLTVALLAYPITVFVVHEPWSQVLRATLVPQLQFTPAFLFIITGVLGTTITPYMFFWEASQEVEELHQRGVVSLKAAPRVAAAYIRYLRLDNIGGMLASQAVSWCVIVVGASVLNAGGATSVSSAADAAKALLPLVHTFPHAGLLAELLFAVGIVALGLLAVPVLAASSGYAVSEVVGWPEGLNLKLKQAHGFYGVIAAGTVIGLVMNFVGLNPVRALIIAAVVNGVVAPPLIAVLALIARNQGVMGKYRSGWLSSALLWITCAGMSAAAIALVVSMLHR